MPEPTPHAEFLRRFGHAEAADALEAAAALTPAATTTEPEPAPTAPSPASAREEEGRSLLAALRRDTDGRYGVPDEPAA